MAGIPISSLVRVTPSVIAPAPGFGPLNTLILTQNTGLVNQRLREFTTLSSVGSFFSTSSTEYAQAEVFFSGYTGATNLPNQLAFAYYVATAITSTLVGSTLNAMTLSQLQAISGTIVIGALNSFSVSFAGVASFAAAGTLLNSAAGAANPGLQAGYDPYADAFYFDGVNIATPALVSGTAVAALGLTQATGASVFPAQTANDPTAWITDYANRLNFSGFTTAFEPNPTELLAFAAWTATQDDTVLACLWDNSAGALTLNNANCFGAQVMAQGYSGVAPIYADPLAAVFPLAVMSSLNFGTTNGRQSMAYRANSLITPTVTDGNTATTLLGNGYSFYGGYAGEGAAYQFFYDGHVAGPFAWIDSFVCQIQFSAELDKALIALLQSVGQVPFNAQGDGLIEAALADPISAAINFGTIQQGVTLSASEAAEVNAAAGKQIDSLLSTRGWYVLPGASTAAPSVRVARGPIEPQVFYTDGESVQTISLSSVDVL